MGAPSLRVWGAEDYYDILGSEGQFLIKERGRWDSDIAFIYARPSAERHLANSRKLADSSSINIENLVDRFSQPAFRIAASTDPGWVERETL